MLKQTVPPWWTQSTSGLETSRPSQPSAGSHVLCTPSALPGLQGHSGAPTAITVLSLTPDNSQAEVSLVWACVSPLSAVFLPEGAAACSSPGLESVQGWPHKCSDAPGLQLPPSPVRNPRWGSGLTSFSSLKILSSPNKSSLPPGTPTAC